MKVEPYTVRVSLSFLKGTRSKFLGSSLQMGTQKFRDVSFMLSSTGCSRKWKIFQMLLKATDSKDTLCIDSFREMCMSPI
jgi:hypothetical protein